LSDSDEDDDNDGSDFDGADDDSDEDFCSTASKLKRQNQVQSFVFGRHLVASPPPQR
jgi:hypothetical protein